MPKAIELLADFIERHRNRKYGASEWLNGDDMAVYVRKSVPRILNDGHKYPTLDIASVTVYRRGQGHFTKFLREAHAMNPWPATYVENVLEPRLGKFLLGEGFTQHTGMYPASFYLKKEEQNEPVEKHLRADRREVAET
jgi:hypothetical protein